jgi:hypothetical protein
MAREYNAIGYNEDERAIYVQNNEEITRVFSNKSKEDFEQFVSSKQHDYLIPIASCVPASEEDLPAASKAKVDFIVNG